jgi:SAM-dependent methyltransferase
VSAEFDRLATGYDERLKNPVRDSFAPGSEFFVVRKIDVLQAFARSIGVDTRQQTWLDVGCGKGQLLRAGQSHFAAVHGCDVSTGMIDGARDLHVVPQSEPDRIPFGDASVDWVTAVCVYHHVEPRDRARLTAEIRRVLKPGGIFAIVEHNPLNPAVQVIVRRTQVDEHAILLTAGRARHLLRDAGFAVLGTRHFLYVPQRLYRWAWIVERALERLPLGGQYAVFARKMLPS